MNTTHRAPHPVPKIITIVWREGNHYDVHLGETYCDSLCWEEMLGQVATITLVGKPRFPMLTPDEHMARAESLCARAVPAPIVPEYETRLIAALRRLRHAEHAPREEWVAAIAEADEVLSVAELPF